MAQLRSILSAIVLLVTATIAHNALNTLATNTRQLARINFSPRMSTTWDMENSTRISYQLVMDSAKIKSSISGTDLAKVVIQLHAVTTSPQFDIVEIVPKKAENFTLSFDQLGNTTYTYNGTVELKASYIGHAHVEARIFVMGDQTTISEKLDGISEITVIRTEGRLETIFKVSVISLAVITYIGLGSQIERERIAKLMESPNLPIVAFLIAFLAMPVISWCLALLIVRDQLYYRFGSFVLSCCPTASAATMWVTMFKANKELSITVQMLSTVSALFTMPMWLFTLGVTLTQGQYDIKVPYLNLVQTLLSLLLALVVGYVIGNYSEKFANYVRKILRPLTFAVLLFIIIFSSYVYWYIYKMFDWRVILLGFSITSCTYLVCGFLGYLYSRDYEYMTTVAIVSAYKNSGVAFYVLLVTLPSPDTYIAFVPCLTQVLATSMTAYVILTIQSFVVRFSKSKGYTHGKTITAETRHEVEVAEQQHQSFNASA